MAISALQFGSNLRPSTVDAMNKINEIIAVVNDLDASDPSSDIAALTTRVTNVEATANTNSTNITTLQNTVSGHTTDLTAINTALFTPLASNENV